MLSKFHLRRKGKTPSLPVAFDNMASSLHSPSGNEEIALPPAPPPTVRSLSDDGILSSVHTGSAAYTAGGGSSCYADDWLSFAESTWSFHTTRTRLPEAGSLAQQRRRTRLVFAASGQTNVHHPPEVWACLASPSARPLARTRGTISLPSMFPLRMTTTTMTRRTLVDLHIYLPLPLTKRTKTYPTTTTPMLLCTLLPPAVQVGITASHHKRLTDVCLQRRCRRQCFLVSWMLSPQPDP
jgi:hypothetical protein